VLGVRASGGHVPRQRMLPRFMDASRTNLRIVRPTDAVTSSKTHSGNPSMRMIDALRRETKRRCRPTIESPCALEPPPRQPNSGSTNSPIARFEAASAVKGLKLAGIKAEEPDTIPLAGRLVPALGLLCWWPIWLQPSGRIGWSNWEIGPNGRSA